MSHNFMSILVSLSQIVCHAVCFAIEIKRLKPCYIKWPCFALLTLFWFSIPSVSKVIESFYGLFAFLSSK